MKLRFELFLSLFVSFALAQIPENIQRYRDEPKGAYYYRLQGIMDGNLVRTLYSNNGEVGQWPYSPSLEWPRGSGHQYLDGFTFMVGAQVIAPGNNQVIHILETSYREEMPRDPVTGLFWGFEPVPGYANPSNSKIALSNDNNSFPTIWPSALGLGNDWNGYWYGFYGKGTKENILETFYVMDDSKDGKYKRVPYKYFPIAADSERGGLGLRVEIRGMQFEHQLLQDILFWNYTVINISDHDYDSTVFGIFLDPGVGGPSSGNDDANYSSVYDLCYAWDHIGQGDPTYGNWKPGYVGISVLNSPNKNDNKYISSLSITPLSDKGPNGVWPKNNEVMWRKMTGGFVDTAITNSNVTVVIGSNVFNFPKWISEKFDVAMFLGNDLSEIVMKKYIAQIVHDNNFIIPDSISNFGNVKLTIQSPSVNSSVSGNVNVSWDIQGAAGNTTSYVYISSNGGTDWRLLGVDNIGLKSLLWDTSLFPDGIFYVIRIMTFAENGIGFIESEKPFTVNNPGNVKPEIKLINFKSKSTLQGNYTIKWLGGDADGDLCTVNLYYRSSYETKKTIIVSNISASAGAYQWDTKNVSNSSAFDYELQAEIVSNADTSSVIASGFSIVNTFIPKPGEPFIVSKKTNGTGTINFNIIDPSSITGHSYLLTFFSKINFTITGTITDLNSGLEKLTDIEPLDYNHETKTFDGIRLSIANDKLEPDYAQIGWVSGTSTFPISANYDYTIPSLNTRLPFDYQISFSNVVVDTTLDLDPIDYPVIPIRFSIKNLSLNKRAFCLFQDMDGSISLTKGDTIKIIDIIDGNLYLVWSLGYGSVLSNVPEPTLGDIYNIKTKKPFAPGDSIIFTTQGLTIVKKMSNVIPSEFMLHQNYPNPFNPSTIIRYSVPERSIVRFTIFNTLGQTITQAVNETKDAGFYEYSFTASQLSSGIYFYRIEVMSENNPSKTFVNTKKMVLMR